MRSMDGIIQQRRKWSATETSVVLGMMSVGIVVIVLRKVEAIGWICTSGVLVPVMIVAFVLAVRGGIRDARRPPDYRV